jgi:hypothetical protein
VRPSRWLEVRCCCQPQLLLGWLPVPDACELRVGEVCRYVAHERLHRWPVRDGQLSIEQVRRSTAEVVAFEIREWHGPDLPVAGGPWSTRLALRAEGVELDTLRRIRVFVESLEMDEDEHVPALVRDLRRDWP